MYRRFRLDGDGHRLVGEAHAAAREHQQKNKGGAEHRFQLTVHNIISRKSKADIKTVLKIYAVYLHLSPADLHKSAKCCIISLQNSKEGRLLPR